MRQGGRQQWDRENMIIAGPVWARPRASRVLRESLLEDAALGPCHIYEQSNKVCDRGLAAHIPHRRSDAGRSRP